MASPITPGKTALVTGASRGLGRAFATRFLREGLRVVGTARDPSAVEPLEGVTWLRLDLGDAAQLATLRGSWDERVGPVDVLVNNAGFGDFGPLEQFSTEAVRQHLAVLLEAPIGLAQAVLPGMRARRSGAIVNVASLAAELPIPFLTLYDAAKAGLAGFSQALQLETAGSGVQVVDFRPGDFRTEFYRHSHCDTAGRAELARTWEAMQAHVAQAPVAEGAADALWRALRRGRSGTVRTGSWFQARLAAWGARHLPERWMRRRILAYYGLKGD